MGRPTTHRALQDGTGQGASWLDVKLYRPAPTDPLIVPVKAYVKVKIAAWADKDWEALDRSDRPGDAKRGLGCWYVVVPAKAPIVGNPLVAPIKACGPVKVVAWSDPAWEALEEEHRPGEAKRGIDCWYVVLPSRAPIPGDPVAD